MYRSVECSSPWLAPLQQHLQENRYRSRVAQKYQFAARCFLRDLGHRGKAIESVSPTDIDQYLYGLNRLRDQQPLTGAFRMTDCAAIKMLMRLVHNGNWPPEIVPTTPDEIAIQEVVNDYDFWMKELRGLSESTRRHCRSETVSLLRWLRDHEMSIATLSIPYLDAYIEWRVVAMRRGSKKAMIGMLRGVLRYLHGSGRLPLDLTGAIEGPTIYDLESIPSTIRREDIDRALEAARCDHSPLGRRDYAIWMLLSTYGLRSGEIRNLCLSDIDWRHERLHIRHTKTGAHSELPLLRGPADALLDYLKHGRPKTTFREVFLQAVAPYGPLRGGLNKIMDRRLQAVGVSLTGKQGAHVLRHSRAESLLRGGVSIKVIGDVLGHHSEQATAAYLKLAIDDLRAIALDLPSEVSA